MTKLGLHFGQELAAAGLNNKVVFFTETGEIHKSGEWTKEEEGKLAALLKNHDPAKTVYPTPPAGERRISKVQLFGAMTDAEYDLFETTHAKQKKRERAIFDNATEIREDHELFPKLEYLLKATYGDQRGQELLDASVF